MCLLFGDDFKDNFFHNPNKQQQILWAILDLLRAFFFVDLKIENKVYYFIEDFDF
jgi:hypothetical protein